MTSPDPDPSLAPLPARTPAAGAADAWQVVTPKAPAARGAISRMLAFAWEEKLWWLVPMAVTLVTLSALVFFASRQQVAPFFYAVNG